MQKKRFVKAIILTLIICFPLASVLSCWSGSGAIIPNASAQEPIRCKG